jgi:hypothetical protein
MFLFYIAEIQATFRTGHVDGDYLYIMWWFAINPAHPCNSPSCCPHCDWIQVFLFAVFRTVSSLLYGKLVHLP